MEELSRWLAIARGLDCSLLVDEFYSHYVWTGRPGQLPIESAARYVEDVNRDPIVIFDGLTKNWRYPGWRVTWTVGPRAVIEAVSSAGSFLDGGGSKPIQRAFLPKKESVLRRARAMGMTIDREPDGTFYAWVSVAELPASISDGMSF